MSEYGLIFFELVIGALCVWLAYERGQHLGLRYGNDAWRERLDAIERDLRRLKIPRKTHAEMLAENLAQPSAFAQFINGVRGHEPSDATPKKDQGPLA